MWVTIEAREAGWCNGVNDGNLKVPPASPVEFDRCAMDVDAGTTATGTMTATLQHLPDPQIIENLLRQLQFQQQQTHLREQQHEQLASEVWTHEHSERHTPQAMRFHWPLSMCSGEPSQAERGCLKRALEVAADAPVEPWAPSLTSAAAGDAGCLVRSPTCDTALWGANGANGNFPRRVPGTVPAALCRTGSGPEGRGSCAVKRRCFAASAWGPAFEHRLT
eukprot:TRINITY_DN401_c0_g1_i1.p1 TRINITY_DN401_c0_g1~~TRINITY_DN401_c0_g1_i1.p1  ORF type:complete len:221 (+),score=34.72 TRINITY_DN401_c0_g1_i1:282-944(+)